MLKLRGASEGQGPKRHPIPTTNVVRELSFG